MKFLNYWYIWLTVLPLHPMEGPEQPRSESSSPELETPAPTSPLTERLKRKNKSPLVPRAESAPDLTRVRFAAHATTKLKEKQRKNPSASSSLRSSNAGESSAKINSATAKAKAKAKAAIQNKKPNKLFKSLDEIEDTFKKKITISTQK